MRSINFVFVLFLTFYGCSGKFIPSVFGEVDCYLICQLRFFDESGNYINSDDKRVEELIKCGSSEFVTKTSIHGEPLSNCNVINTNPIIFELVEHIEYSDKWRYLILEPYRWSCKYKKLKPNERQVFVIKHPRRPRVVSWTTWKKPDFIGDLPETSFVLLGNNKEDLSQIKEPPYFEIRYRVVAGDMKWGALTITEQNNEP